ncbi:MAG: precorrin-8X methylmutase [Huintestinicola sp.]
MKIENIRPADIERRSMEIISEELSQMDMPGLSESELDTVKRVIHTTADFDYLYNLRFTKNAVESGLEALSEGAVIVTDTRMAESGISKPALKHLGCELHCFMSDEDVAIRAKNEGVTRASVSMDKAAELYTDRKMIFAIGNAPTALIRLSELVKEGRIQPKLIIGVPVGFVNVAASKEMIIKSGVPSIVAMGRKGGSTVAAAICNSLLYRLYKR